MKQTAAILGPWVGSGTEEDSNRPQIGDDYTIDSWTDVTGQPSENLLPDPNSYEVKVVAEDTAIAAIGTDNTYNVLWVEDIIEEETP